MDEFVNTLDKIKFRQTNQLWNELMLNDPWSVGYVATLIELKSFENKEDWESFYYKTGDYRDKKLTELSAEQLVVLEDEQLIRTNRKSIDLLSTDLKNINTSHGRTVKQLAKKGQILYQRMQGLNSNISLEECIESVRFRVICETWNGIVLREHNTVKKMKNKFPNLFFKKMDGDFDHHFAVDYELYNEAKLICGIQIKPKSYLWNTVYLNKAKAANARKNKEYFYKFSKPVFDVISSTKGEIYNKDVFVSIRNLLV